MNKTLITWWRMRTLREQRLLLAMAGLAVIVLAWLLVVRPLADALSNAKERHGAAVIALAQVRADAAAIEAAETGAAPVALGPLDTMVSQAAIEAGFSVARLDRQGTARATLVMEAVRPQAFFAWVDQMEGRGLIVERLSTTANADRTLAVQVTFRQRSG